MESQTRTVSRRSEAMVIVLLIACLGALGLHAATQTTTFDPVAATVGNARLLTLAITQYTQDYDENLPPTQNIAVFQTALRPYVPDPAVFASRVTGQPFVPNAAIGGRALTSLGDLSSVAAFRDVLPPSTAPATVGFLDRHIERGGIVQETPADGSYANAKELALAVIQYTQDYDGTFPPMKTQAEFQTAVSPFVRNGSPFIDPANGKPFQPNPALSGVFRAGLSDPHTTVLLQSATPYSNGVPTTAYADGQVTPVPPDFAVSPGAQDTSNLRQIGLATSLYSQDNNEMLPPTTDTTAFQDALLPYTLGANLFVSPGSGLPYVLNPAISSASLGSIVGPSNTEEARDAQLNSDGTLNHLELDGHVKQDQYFLPKSVVVAPDDTTRLLWPKASQQAALWTVLPSSVIKNTDTLTTPSNALAFSVGADGRTRLLWRDTYGTGSPGVPITGAITLSSVGADGTAESAIQFGPYDGWSAQFLTTGTDSRSRLLWQRTDGTLALWTLSPAGDYLGTVSVPSLAGGTPVGLALGVDGLTRLLWKSATGGATLWTLTDSGQVTRTQNYETPSGNTLTALGLGADGSSCLLWSDGQDHAVVTTQTISRRSSSRRIFALEHGGTASQIAVGKAGDLRVLWEAADGSGRLQTLTPLSRRSSALLLTPYL